ncbi:hypothetical protein ABPG72_018571 [Tetrahymena utriculariae]
MKQRAQQSKYDKTKQEFYFREWKIYNSRVDCGRFIFTQCGLKETFKIQESVIQVARDMKLERQIISQVYQKILTTISKYYEQIIQQQPFGQQIIMRSFKIVIEFATFHFTKRQMKLQQLIQHVYMEKVALSVSELVPQIEPGINLDQRQQELIEVKVLFNNSLKKMQQKIHALLIKKLESTQSDINRMVFQLDQVMITQQYSMIEDLEKELILRITQIIYGLRLKVQFIQQMPEIQFR